MTAGAGATYAMRSADSALRFLKFLTVLPHGVYSFTDNPAIPQTSSNVAHIATQSDSDIVLLSIRSSKDAEMNAFADNIMADAATYGMEVMRSGAYPSWQPRSHSRLLAKCKKAYVHACGAPPKVEVIHAGLEPAVIARIFPELDMVSCGPLIVNPHSPKERLSIQSTARVYCMLGQLLRDW